MANNKKGLPSNYSLDIPQATEGPVRLGDYLDDFDTKPVAAPAMPQRTPDESKVIAMPKASPAPPEAAPAEAGEEQREPAKDSSPRKRPKKRKGPVRKQINATPETLKMIEELIVQVQTDSEQSDAKASEVFHALVLALYEAREFLELGDIPIRGRWGTPTAKAFPINLKNAFQEAIAAAYKKHRR